jgi:hypothetical protein
MILDLLQLTGNRYGLDAFEVVQYIQLSDDIELHMSMGATFEEALSLAYETTEVI